MTMSGSRESLAGSKSTVRLAMAKLRTNTLHRAKSAAMGTSRTRTMRAISATSMTRRLSKRSMITPANIPKSR